MINLNHRYEVGDNKYITPISIIHESDSGFVVYNCYIERKSGVCNYISISNYHIIQLIKRYENSKP